jgi:nucleoid-associated protein YgaU
MSLEKALIINTVKNEKIPVMFNPEEYTVNRDINYAQTAVPGLSAPIIQFVHGNAETLEMELFLDTYESHKESNRTLNQAGADVRALVRSVTNLMTIEPSTHAPPVLLFTWASLSFTCVLTRANQRYIMFLPDGTPVRARVQVTFSEFRNVDLEAKEIKRETADYSKLHLVRQGESLTTIAAAQYGDARLWRPIALRNGIEDPRVLEAGTRLLVPQLPFRDPASGEVYA